MNPLSRLILSMCLVLASQQLITQDNCSTAILIPDITICDENTFDLSGMTDSGQGACFTGTDTWYRFIATNEHIYFTVPFDPSSSTNNVNFEVFETCGGNLVFCGNTCNGCGFTRSGFVIGQEYFLRMSLDPGVSNGGFCIQQTCNVTISNVVVSNCDPADNTYDVSFDYTYEDIDPSLAFEIRLANNFFSLTVSQSSGNGQYAINDIANADDVNQFLIMSHPSPFCGGSAFIDAPAPCVVPPINDLCVDAIHLGNLSDCESIFASIVGAIADPTETIPNNNSGDVWYSFTASHTEMLIRHVDSPSSSGFISFQLYESCTFSQIIGSGNFIFEGSNRSISGLTVGQDYVLQFQIGSKTEAEISIGSDVEAPLPLCQPDVIFLPSSGSATFYASPFRLTPYDPVTHVFEEIDNCTSLEDLHVRISRTPNNFTNHLTFDCSELGKLIDVYHEVSDLSGNTATCVSTVVLRDPQNSCPCVDDLFINGIAPFQDYRAIQTLTSDATVTNYSRFNAGNAVQLEPNFEVLDNAIFEAFIEACSN